jgi:hypothetical protein
MVISRANGHPRRSLSPDERVELLRRIDMVPEGADEDEPAFLSLLEYWRSLRVPWWALPVVRAARTHNGWITASVSKVLDDLHRLAGTEDWGQSPCLSQVDVT